MGSSLDLICQCWSGCCPLEPFAGRDDGERLSRGVTLGPLMLNLEYVDVDDDGTRKAQFMPVTSGIVRGPLLLYPPRPLLNLTFLVLWDEMN